jgi:hypothetical protein
MEKEELFDAGCTDCLARFFTVARNACRIIE